ncbi:MAG: hypothetical protein FWH54_02085, partial [Methanobrevibacter sp.]|nr:hypothetical protein [Methanobrevibacter sp.]
MKINYEIQIRIIYYLRVKKYIGSRHTPIEHVCKVLSKYPCKQIKKELKNLQKSEILEFKKTFHGTDVYLNIKKIKEI